MKNINLIWRFVAAPVVIACVPGLNFWHIIGWYALAVPLTVYLEWANRRREARQIAKAAQPMPPVEVAAQPVVYVGASITF